MADLEARPPPFAPSRPRSGAGGLHASGHSRPRSPPARDTPSEGQNAEEAIMIGSSDEEDEDDRPLAARPGLSIEEQRARLHRNQRGTPIPRAAENGMRIQSPPPPMPGTYAFRHFHRPPEMPQQRNHILANLQHRIFASRFRTPEGQQIMRFFDQDHRFGHLIGLAFGRPMMDMAGRAEPAAPTPPEEYDVRMTHASVKPRIGFSYDFVPEEEAKPQVRTRTTIVIPDSPPLPPADRKGKGRARDADPDDDVLDLESDDWNAHPTRVVSSPGSGSGSGSGSSSLRGRKRKRQAMETMEIVEVLSDDESDEESGHVSGSGSGSAAASQSVQPERMQSVLGCAGCRRPLRTGGERLWALRCGHMIDSRCYREYHEKAVKAKAAAEAAEKEAMEKETAEKAIPVLGEGGADVVNPAESSSTGRTTRGSKRRKTHHNTSKGKGKGKAALPPPPPPPLVTETCEWTCPVANCKRVHWSERVVTPDASGMWQPMKETGAIPVFV